jgi:hypothetical protein
MKCRRPRWAERVAEIQETENNTEENCLLGCNTVYSVQRQLTFRRNILPPSSRLRSVLVTCFMLVSCLTYSSILKKEGACFFEILDEIQRTTRCYNHRCENLRSCKKYAMFNASLKLCHQAVTVFYSVHPVVCHASVNTRWKMVSELKSISHILNFILHVILYYNILYYIWIYNKIQSMIYWF